LLYCALIKTKDTRHGTELSGEHEETARVSTHRLRKREGAAGRQETTTKKEKQMKIVIIKLIAAGNQLPAVSSGCPRRRDGDGDGNPNKKKSE